MPLPVAAGRRGPRPPRRPSLRREHPVVQVVPGSVTLASRADKPGMGRRPLWYVFVYTGISARIVVRICACFVGMYSDLPYVECSDMVRIDTYMYIHVHRAFICGMD